MSEMQKPSALEQLQRHHPLIIEGMSGYDKRDPLTVASIIVRQLTDRWSVNPPTKPVLLVTQGDPYEREVSRRSHASWLIRLAFSGP